MRIKDLLPAVAMLLSVALTTSCLKNSHEEVTYGTDPTIKAFAIDTVGEAKEYLFAIDNVNGIIYNPDSLPVGSEARLKTATIKRLQTAGGIVYIRTINGNDTLLDVNRAVDLSRARHLTVLAQDLNNKKEYDLQVRVHRHDPDSLLWQRVSELPQALQGRQRAALRGKEAFIYNISGGQLQVHHFSLQANAKAQTQNVQGLQELPESVLAYEGKILASYAGKVYASEDGVHFSPSANFTGHVKLLLAVYPSDTAEKLLYLKEEGGKVLLCSKGSLTAAEHKDAQAEGFPTQNLSYTTYTHKGAHYTAVVGEHLPPLAGDVARVWTFNGTEWAAMSQISGKAACPALKNPEIFYYADQLYIWGDKLENIYTSPNRGVAWQEAQPKFAVQQMNWEAEKDATKAAKKEFRGRKAFSTFIDTENGYLYVAFGKEDGLTFTEKTKQAAESATEAKEVKRGPYSHPAELWRARLNKVWFTKAAK